MRGIYSKKTRPVSRDNNQPVFPFFLTNNSEVDPPVASGRPLKVHPALVDAGVVEGDAEEGEDGGGNRARVELGFAAGAHTAHAAAAVAAGGAGVEVGVAEVKAEGENR